MGDFEKNRAPHVYQSSGRGLYGVTAAGTNSEGFKTEAAAKCWGWKRIAEHWIKRAERAEPPLAPSVALLGVALQIPAPSGDGVRSHSAVSTRTSTRRSRG